MKITHIQMYDLYRKGNFIKSFISLDTVDEFLKKEFSDAQWKYPDENIRKVEMNSRDYSVIESFHCFFT